jgi:tetratricopeptide (TPR) repeat protein
MQRATTVAGTARTATNPFNAFNALLGRGLRTVTHSRARNETLRRAIAEAGISYDRLAADIRDAAAEAGTLLRTNRSAVAHWVAGVAPGPDTAGYIAEALSRRLGRHFTPADLGWTGGPGHEKDRADGALGASIGPDPLDIVRRLGEADINRRQIITAAAYSVAAAALPLGTAQAAEARLRATTTAGRHVGAADIAAVRAMLQAFTRIDERQGGQHGRTAVVQYLRSDVADLTRGRFATETDRTDALGTAAAVTYLCGWKAYDAGEHGLAQRYYLQALALARESGHPAHEAWILRTQANSAMDISRPEHTLDLADAALSLTEGRVEPAYLSLFVITRARALALAGRGPEAATEIRRAQDLVTRKDEEACEELPFWAAVWTSRSTANVATNAAKALVSLRDHANAERHYTAAASTFDRVAGRARVTALSLSDLGRQQAAQGHVEQACSTWGRALDYFEGVRSDQAAKQVTGIRRQLKVFERRGVGAATHLDHRARDWQLTHA